MATRSPKTTTAKAKPARRRTAAPKTKAAPKASTKPKTTATKRTAARRAAKPKSTAAPVVVDAPKPVVAGPMMRKKELIDAVVARSGMKKKDAKPAVEATLAVLGSALQDGRELNLQPMGKIKVKREKKLASGRMFVARIRQNDAPNNQGSTEETGVAADTLSGKSAAE